MDMKELQQGLQNIQQEDTLPIDQSGTKPPLPEPWLNMGNLMQSYGGWFDNDQGLGELLLGQLRARGVDTQAATEAMLRELLQGLVDDLNRLQQQLTGFTSAIAQQEQKTQAIADAVQATIDAQHASPTATEITPPTGADMPVMNDLPPEQAGGEMPPPEQAGGEMPPPEQAGGTTSDRRLKYVLSDASMKQIVQSATQKKNGLKLNNNIISACKGGY